MKVLKFGGTSVGSVDSLRNVKKIVEGCDEQVIVVVSALGGITDRLIATANMAAEANDDYKQSFNDIVARHHDVIAGIVPTSRQAAVRDVTDALLEELSGIFHGVRLVSELSARTLDLIVSFGERISSHIVTAIIDGAERFDSLTFIKTKLSFGKHILDNDATQPLIHDAFDSFEGPVAIVPGFISTDSERGEITNLGRGGSDYTAAILAAALDAEILEIWTDVDGFMTADPRVVDSPMVIDRMTFIEAMELCNFGAKVIYPPTIYPVFHKNIPIVIKNTFNPSAPGTLVTDTNPVEDNGGNTVKGISSINDTCVLTVSGLGMVGEPGFNSRIFNALARNGVSIFMVSQGSSENIISFAVKNEAAETSVKALRHEFADELESGKISSIEMLPELATVAVVGRNMKADAILAGKLLNVLGREGIRILAFAHGGSDTNISFVIDLKNLRKALGLIHNTVFAKADEKLPLTISVDGELAEELKGLIDSNKDRLVNCEVRNVTCGDVAVIDSREVCSFAGVPVVDTIRQLKDAGDKIVSLNAFFKADSVDIAETLSRRITDLMGLNEQPKLNVDQSKLYHLLIKDNDVAVESASEADFLGANSLVEIVTDRMAGSPIVMKGFATESRDVAAALFNDILTLANKH